MVEHKIKELYVDGSSKKSGHWDRYLVTINGKLVWLRGNAFRYLVRLAYFRTMSKVNYSAGGWTLWAMLDTERRNQLRYLWLMKKELQEVLGVDFGDVYECDSNNYGYRLLADPDGISFNKSILEKFPDADVRELFNE